MVGVPLPLSDFISNYPSLHIELIVHKARIYSIDIRKEDINMIKA